MDGYILEVQRFNPNGHMEHPEWCGKSEHVGYMNYVFRTKEEAANYYDIHNPHMRKMHIHGHWVSDWDPITHLMYVVREHDCEYLTIPPFNPEDAPKVTTNKDRSVTMSRYPRVDF